MALTAKLTEQLKGGYYEHILNSDLIPNQFPISYFLLEIWSHLSRNEFFRHFYLLLLLGEEIFSLPFNKSSLSSLIEYFALGLHTFSTSFLLLCYIELLIIAPVTLLLHPLLPIFVTLRLSNSDEVPKAFPYEQLLLLLQI